MDSGGLPMVFTRVCNGQAYWDTHMHTRTHIPRVQIVITIRQEHASLKRNALLQQ